MNLSKMHIMFSCSLQQIILWVLMHPGWCIVPSLMKSIVLRNELDWTQHYQLFDWYCLRVFHLTLLVSRTALEPSMTLFRNKRLLRMYECVTEFRSTYGWSCSVQHRSSVLVSALGTLVHRWSLGTARLQSEALRPPTEQGLSQPDEQSECWDRWN